MRDLKIIDTLGFKDENPLEELAMNIKEENVDQNKILSFPHSEEEDEQVKCFLSYSMGYMTPNMIKNSKEYDKWHKAMTKENEMFPKARSIHCDRET
jgi:aspartate carbamoyltransferase regulatory subunit